MKTFFSTTGRGWLWGLACVSALLIVSSTAVFSITDTDGDGLDDADEVNIYHTDPNKFDTDGDGMGDGDEIRAGTNPLNALSVFKLLGPLEKISGGWRVKWQSVPGRIYKIQRAGNDQLNTTNWTEIGQVTAAGLASSFDDAFATNGQRFYRVTLETVAVASYYQGNPDRFLPLNAQNQPIEGGLIPLNPDGSLTGFEFRPAGRSLAGSAQGFFIRFPNGAKVVDIGGVQYFQFSLATAGFGTNSPFQLKTPLSMNGSIAHLPVGEVDVANVSTAFGIQATNGLEVQLFGRFPFRIVSGVFADTGLRGGRISSPDLNLPLPGISGAYPGFVIDLTPKGGLRIPFAGKFSLPDGSSFLPEITVATNRPLWVEFKANGGLAVGGRADVQFPNGPSLSVDFGLDDPSYHLQFTAGKIHVPLLDSLSDLLPPAPTVANTADAAQLDAARKRLGVFDEAMLKFSASTVGAAPAGVDSTPGTPSEAFATATSVLEAWAASAESASGALSPLALRFALKHASQSASASRDLDVVAGQMATLLRIQRAMTAGFLSGDTAISTELSDALTEARAAVLQRARSSDAVRSLEQMKTVMGSLLEIDRYRQLLNQPVDAELIAAERQLLNRFLVALAQTQQIAAGVYQPAAGSSVALMNRFVAGEYLRQIAEVVRVSQLLGLDFDPATPINELKMQFGLRMWGAVQSVLLASEAAADYTAFIEAMEDALELVALNQTGFFPGVPEAGQLPGASFLSGLPARLDAVFVGDMARPAGERSLNNQRRDLRRLTRILRQLPAGFSYNPTPIQRAYDRLETTLGQSMLLINGYAMSDLVALLDAGIVHSETRDRFSLPSPVSWETARLPQVVTRIATLGQQTNGWSEIHDAIAILLAEADRLATNSNQTRRQLYLSKAAELETASRVVAAALWQNEKTRRIANPLLQVADMLLPGDIFIDRVAGAVRFDLQQKFIEGSFSGDLRLPKFGAALHVQNASINSGGAFALNLDGQTSLGTSGNSLGTMSIPARRPLAISFQPPADLKLAGGVKLALNNGMSFEAYGALTDPVYNFGFSAGGLRFDLATNLFGRIPEPVPGRLAQLGPNIRSSFADYLGSLGATVEPLSGLTDPPVFADLGEPPDYSDSVFTISTDPLNAAATGIAIAVGAPFVVGYVAADATASQINAIVTPVVKTLVKDARREMDRARRELAKARSDVADATGVAKEDARRALVKRLEATGDALKKVADTAQKIVQKQQAGEMGIGPDTNPAQTPEAAAASNEQQASTEEAMDDIPATLAVEIELGLMASTIDFFETREKLGGDPGDFTQAAQMYIDNAKKRVLPRYGMDLNGTITNQAKFNSLTEDELKEAGEVVAKIEQVSQLAGVQNPGPMFVNATREVLVRRRNLKAQEIQDAMAATYRIGGSERASVDALKQEKLMQLYQESAEILQTMQAVGVTGVTFPNRFDGSPGASNPEADYNDALSAVGTAAGKLAGYLDSSSPTYDRDYAVLWGQQLVAQRLRQWKAKKQEEALKLAQANPAVPAAAKETMRSGLDALARRYFVSVQEWAASSPTLQFNLRSAEQLGRDLFGHARLLERTGSQAPSPSGRPRQQADNLNLAQINSFKLDIFPKYTARITALAEAQKAWWILRRVNSVLLEGLETKATNDLSLAENVAFTAAKDTVEAAGRVAGVLRQGLALQNRPVDLRLPGDVEVEKVFGDVFYNRQTGLIRATFGGRVEFPDLQNAFFEISNATLDNNLNFSIAASTGGPLPFNGVRIDPASISASGGPNQPFNFTGSGTMTVTNGPSVSVSVTWNGTNHALSFDTQAGNLQSLRFTDNLVLFDAGLGFTLRPDSQSGELRANGSAGFFSKGALPPSPKQTNFHLFAENVRAVLAYQPGRVDLIFSNGTLHLPTFFYPTNMAVLCPGTGPATGPTISLEPLNPVQATFLDGSTPSVGFSGQLDFRQFGLAVPDIPGLAAAICSAQLKFSSTALPYLTNVNASLQIPLPRSTNIVDFTNGVFTLTGYPSGRVELRNDLTMLDVNGFKFTLLGQGHPGCPGGSGLTVYPSSGFNQIPAFKLDGGIRVDAPLAMLTGTNGDQVFGLACGGLSITNGLRPDLVVNTLEFGGTFHLGSGGPVIKNALISLQDLPNLFRLDDQHQFLVRLEGALQIPNGPEFTMQDAHFSFFDYQRLPKFSVASVGVNNESFTMLNYLPAKVKQATLAFKAPLTELPYLFYPTNIDLGFSAEIRFPATGNPMFVGAVDKVEVDFDTNNFPRVKQIDGFELGVGGMKIPPVKELGGRIKLGGLSANDPSKIYMVGRLGGSYQGYQVIGQAAFNLFGPLGFCLDVNAGSVGIPLGPTGILITGASGGESFVNNNGDPCDFKTYFSVDAQGNLIAPSSPTPPGLGMSWEAFRNVVERMEADAATFTQNVPGLLNPGQSGRSSGGMQPPTLSGLDNSTTVNLPCPGDCPPATVNIFCQPHPDQAMYPGKVIAKFSSINESTLNGIGITPSFIQGLGSDFSSMAGAVSHAIRVQIQSLTPPPDPGLLPPSAVASLGTVITNTLNALETSFSNLCRATLANPQAADTSYNIIKRLVYEGLPCPDVTMAVSGNVSYAGVSSVAYIGGKGLLSTTGAGGVVGTIYVLGIPFGEARVFVAATDAQGNPNPSICGQASVGFGPLEFGELKLSYGCPGCVNGVMAGFFDLIGALSDSVLNRITAKVAPEIAAQHLGRIQLLLALSNLSTQKKLGFFAELANEPLTSLPPDLPQVFFQGIANTYDSINPIVIACGNVGPKLFGLPLGSDIVGVKMFATKEEFAGSFDFSLSALLGAYGPFLPLGETATMSFSMAVRDAYKFVFGGLAGGFAPGSSVAYVQSAIDYMLQNTSYGMAFDFSPFGFKTFDAAARVVIPNLTTHPVLPWSGWVRPEDRGMTNLPSRHDLVLAAIATDKLGDAVNWRGTTNDLYTVYPEGSPQRAALSGLSLQKDYFPHGGVIGGALLTLPAALTEKPPVDKFQIVANPNAAPLDRVLTALDLIQNYFLRFNTNGELAFYIPAPNPPVLYDNNGLLLGQSQLQSIATNLTPQGVLDTIKSFNIANLRVGNFYPIEQAFIRGYLDGQLLGVPIVRSDVLGLPANQERTEGFLSVTSNIPNGSWLKQFIPQASLIFDMRGLPPQPIEKRFVALAAQLQAAVDTNASAVALSNLAVQALSSLTADLPKVQLTADLQVGLNMPAPLADISHFNGTAQLHAFSPRYEPAYQTNNTGPLARVRREGGIAFQGSLSLRLNGTDIANIPNVELSAVPRDSGLPVISGQFIAPVIALPGLSLNNWLVDFASDPSPHFNAQGSISGLGVNLFAIQPLSGGSLTGRVDVAGTPPNMTANLALSSSQLLLPSIYAERILIHGATRNDPFTFSSTGPWNATLELTNNLTLGVAGVNFVSLGAGGLFTPITFAGNGTSSGSFTIGFGPGAGVTLFPGDATLQRSVSIGAGITGSLKVNSDATFLLTTTLGGSALNFNGIDVPAGANLSVSNNGVSITWFINNGATMATLSIGADKQVIFSGSAELPPLNFGIFQITGATGGNLSGSFNNDGFAVGSGAKLILLADWLQNQSLTLNTFTFSNNGAINLSVSAAGQNLSFAGYPFDLSNFTFQRASTNLGGAASLGLAGSLHATPNFPGFPSLSFTGNVSTVGAVFLQSSSASASFFGFPVQRLTNTFQLSAGQFAGTLSNQFQLGNNTGLWTALGSNWFSGVLNPDGSMGLSADGPTNTVAGFGLDSVLFRFNRNAGQNPSVLLEGGFAPPGFTKFRLKGGIDSTGAIFLTPAPPAPSAPLPYPNLNGQVSLLLTNSGVLVSGFLNQAPLPSLSLTGAVFTSGAYSLTGSVATATVLGFPFNNLNLALQGSSGTAGFVAANGSLGLGALGSYAISGGYTNSSSWGLSATQAFNLAPLNLPAANFGAASVLRWNPTSLSVTGAVSGGLVASLGTTANAALNITPGPVFALSGGFTFPAIGSGQFNLRGIGGGNVTGAFNNAGVTASGAELLFNNIVLAALPSFAMTNGGNGDFSFTAGSDAPLSVVVGGFTINNASFTVRRTAGALNVENFSGQLIVPGLNTVVDLLGTLNNGGTYFLAGGLEGTVAVSGLPVTQMGAGASVSLDHQNGLRITGSVGGGIFDTVGQTGATATLFVQTDGSIKLGGSVTIPALTAGAFAITNLGSPSISLVLTNDGLRFPAGLRLMFNGTVFNNFTLPAFTNDANGNVSFSAAVPSLGLENFTIAGAAFNFTRSATAANLNVTAGTFTIPGLTGPSVAMSGALSSDSTFHLVNSATFGSVSFSPSVANVFASIQVGPSSQLVFDRNAAGVISLRLSGTLGGGALNGLSADFTAPGASLLIDSAGNIIPSASFTVSQILLNNFRLAPIGGGNFAVTLDSSGVRMPAGAQLSYLNQPLGSFALPAFTIPANGTFSASFGPAALTLQGFGFNGSGALVRGLTSTNVTINSGATLPLPGLNASVSASGTLTNDGTFLLSNAAAGSFGLPNLPVSAMANSSVSFGRVGGVTTFRVTGNASGGMLGGGAADLRLVNSSVSLTLNTSGAPTLNAAVNIAPFTNSFFSIEGTAAAGANIGATLNNNGLTLNSARLRASLAGLLSGTVALPASVNIPLSGEFDLSIPAPLSSLSVKGFPFNNVTLNVQRFANGELRLDQIAGALGLSGFGQPFSGGTILSDGTVIMDWNGSFALGGFGTGAGGYLHLRSTGMSAGGDFNLVAAGRTFNSKFRFDGTVDTAGNYALTGNGSLDIANIEMPSVSFTFANGVITGSPTLKFGDDSGKLDFVPGNFSLTQSGGVSFSKSIGFDQSVSISGSPSVASINLTASLSASGGNSGQVQVTGSASAFGFDLPSVNTGVGSDLEFTLNFGPNCVRFDLSPVRAKVCGTNWP